MTSGTFCITAYVRVERKEVIPMRRSVAVLFALLFGVALTLPASADAGPRAWVDLLRRPGGDEALVVTTTSGGGRIFVAGLTEGTDLSQSVTVIAYRYDGTVAWRASFRPPIPYEPTYVEDITVSADDREVIVAFPLIGPDDDPMAVAAFDASTGTLDWSWLSTPVPAYPIGLATAPDRVIVAGHAGRRDGDWFVVALRPGSGSIVWTDRYDAPAGDADAGSVVVHDGRAFVAGSIDTKASSAVRTVTYASSDGSVLWMDTFKRARAGTIVGVTGDGTRVLVQAGWRIIEYDTGSGARPRVDRFEPAWRGMIRDVTVDRRGARASFTGNTERVGSGRSDTVTAAFDVRTERLLWLARFDGGGWDEGIDVTWVPSDPPQVVVTGGSERDGVIGWRTLAYGARRGTDLWTDLYRGPLREQGFPRALVAAPGGNRVYVVGYTTTSRRDDFATVAYRTMGR
jgi:hypothetical protein